MYMAYSPLGKAVSPETDPEPPTKSDPMSPALSRFNRSWRVASVAGPFMYPVVLVQEGVVKLPPLLQIYGATFHTSVPSMPRPNWPLALLVRAAASVQTSASVVGGPAMLAAAKSALFQKNTWVFVSS